MKAAIAALAKSDWAGALDAALVEWRKRRSPRVADAIDLIASRIPEDPLRAQLDALITPRVASTLPLIKRLPRDDDPRIASWCLERLATPPFLTPNAEPILLALVATVVRLQDRRLNERAAHLREVALQRLSRKPLWDAVIGAIDRGVKKLGPAAKLTASEQEFLARVDELAAPERTEAELLAAVYANPADDTARAIYADVLQQRGDPRGEFIALQLANPNGPPSPREQELVKKHGKTWLGPLASVLMWGKSYSRTAFRRGFVSFADVMVSANTKKMMVVATAPEWSTVETLERGGGMPEFIAAAPLRAMKQFVFSAELVARNVVMPSVEDVICRDGDLAIASKIRTVFPNVRRITMYGMRDAARVVAALDAPHVELVTWVSTAEQLAAVRETVERSAAEIEAGSPLGRTTRITLSTPSYQLKDVPPAVELVLRGNRYVRE
ncbi:MAG: TIGR02996 domain-containing protein [Kofleriaceae bacterium]